jgi:hypothetical protein
VAAAVKDTVVPDATVWLVGFSVTTGGLSAAEPTLNVAEDVVARPKKLEKTASYSLPFCDDDAVNEYVVERAPEMDVKADPPLETYHCTVGVGDPVAAAVKDAVVPAGTLAFAGCSVILGALNPKACGALVVAGWAWDQATPVVAPVTRFCGAPTTRSVSMRRGGPYVDAPAARGGSESPVATARQAATTVLRATLREDRDMGIL